MSSDLDAKVAALVASMDYLRSEVRDIKDDINGIKKDKRSFLAGIISLLGAGLLASLGYIWKNHVG